MFCNLKKPYSGFVKTRTDLIDILTAFNFKSTTQRSALRGIADGFKSDQLIPRNKISCCKSSRNKATSTFCSPFCLVSGTRWTSRRVQVKSFIGMSTWLSIVKIWNLRSELIIYSYICKISDIRNKVLHIDVIFYKVMVNRNIFRTNECSVQ